MRNVTPSDFLQLTITPEMESAAKAAYDDLEKSKKEKRSKDNTFMTKEELTTGFRGEEMFKLAFPDAVKSAGDDVFQFDFTWKNRKIEEKTKGTTCIPTMEYEGSVYDYHPNQQYDIIVFARAIKIGKKFEAGWLMGWMTKKEFESKKYFVRQGEWLANCGFPARTSTWNASMKDCHPIHTLGVYLDTCAGLYPVEILSKI
jgi:hypothetical protein